MVFERIIADYNMLVVKDDDGDFVKALTVELSQTGLAKFAKLKKGEVLKKDLEEIVRDNFNDFAGTNVWRIAPKKGK